jgi:DNA-binding transcriptional ArsR family regulator
MRVLNLAQPDSGLRLEIMGSLAAEMLASMLVVGDESEWKADDTYDLGSERLERIRRGIRPELLDELEVFTHGCEKIAGHLIGLVYTAPAPRDVPAFLEHLEATPTEELLLHLLAYHMKGHWGKVSEELVVEAVAGDEGSRRRLVAALEEGKVGNMSSRFDLPTHLLEWGPEEVKRRLLALLRAWHVEVWPAFDDEVAATLERDLQDKQRMARGNSPERTIELATNGVQFVHEPAISGVVLIPTYVLRPWVLIGEYDETRIYLYPVSDDSLQVDEAVPPPQLVKLYKALGDANRLRLLKRLTKGSMTLKEATALLGSAKSTAFHHLAILRQAGLVWVREDEDKTYTLRDDLIPQAADLLQGYLRISPVSNRSNRGQPASPARVLHGEV